MYTTTLNELDMNDLESITQSVISGLGSHNPKYRGYIKIRYGYKDVATIKSMIKAYLLHSDPNEVRDIIGCEDDPYCYKHNLAARIIEIMDMPIQHITIDDLPNIRTDKNNGFPNWNKKPSRMPKRLNPNTRSKRQAAFINGTVCNESEDTITHIASGRVWDRCTGATPDQFTEVVV